MGLLDTIKNMLGLGASEEPTTSEETQTPVEAAEVPSQEATTEEPTTEGETLS